jgi:ribosomal protein L7/L12
MSAWTLFTLALRIAVLAGVLVLAARGGYYLLWLLLLIPLAWDIVRVFQPDRPRRPAAKYTEPGAFRVVLQVRSGTPILVIGQIRRTTGLRLPEAQKIFDDAPAIVVAGLSETSAELVADRLRAAGAKAVAAPIGEM